MAVAARAWTGMSEIGCQRGVSYPSLSRNNVSAVLRYISPFVIHSLAGALAAAMAQRKQATHGASEDEDDDDDDDDWGDDDDDDDD